MLLNIYIAGAIIWLIIMVCHFVWIYINRGCKLEVLLIDVIGTPLWPIWVLVITIKAIISAFRK